MSDDAGSATYETSEEREQRLRARVRQARAQAIMNDTDKNEILPRWVYEDAGVEVPPNATDELQRAPKKRHWWQFNR